MAISSTFRQEIDEVARRLLDKKLAEQAPDALSTKRFIEIEDEACEVADALAREVMRLMVARQAEESPAEPACCPSCGRAGRERPPESRKVQTRRGDVGWEEPKFYCLHCRKSFFPSVEGAGD